MPDFQQPEQRGEGSPGAMTMAMKAVAPQGAGPKQLRVGLVQRGKIVEERVVRDRRTVTVGSSQDNLFVLPGLASHQPLFVLRDGSYHLRFDERMAGRVALPTGVHLLEDLASAGVAHPVLEEQGVYEVDLVDDSRGKVTLGDSTFLFQFVEPPPAMGSPQLPASVRGGFVRNIDWLFTAFVVSSYMLFFGFVIFLENADWEIESGISGVPEQMARLIFEEPLEPPEPVPDLPEPSDEPTEEVSETTTTSERDSSARTSSDVSNRSGELNNSSEARARLAEEMGAQVEAMLLGANSAIGGALADVLAGGMEVGSSADLMAQATGVAQATTAGSGQLRIRSGGGTGSGQAGDLESLQASASAGQAAQEGSQMDERQVSGRVSLEGGGGDVGGSGDFDAGLVVRQIRRRMSAVRRCYEQELR